MLTCEAMYGNERGGQMVAMIEDVTAELCPCKQGAVCPLLPLLPRPRV
jgi:hypothetical protein